MIDLPTTVLWLTASRVVAKGVHATGRRLFKRHVRIELDGRGPEPRLTFRCEAENPDGSEAPCIIAQARRCSCPARGDKR